MFYLTTLKGQGRLFQSLGFGTFQTFTQTFKIGIAYQMKQATFVFYQEKWSSKFLQQKTI